MRDIDFGFRIHPTSPSHIVGAREGDVERQLEPEGVVMVRGLPPHVSSKGTRLLVPNSKVDIETCTANRCSCCPI